MRSLVIALLFFATVINYVDRQTLSVLAPVLRDRFHMSNIDYSHVVTVFLLAYMIMQSGSGRILDRLGTRRGMSLTIAWWSAAAMLHAAAGSVFSFGACRFLLGLGEAGNWPGGVKAVSEWFPPNQRAFGIGFFNAGSTVGAMLSPPLIAWLALRFGWQSAFLATGVLGFVWLAFWLALYRAPRVPFGDAGDGAPVRWLALFRYRPVWGLVLARTLADPVWWFYVFWLPEYLKRERNFSLAMIGYFASIPFLAAGIGNLTGGAMSGWLVRRGRAVLWSRKAVMAVSALLMASGIPAVLVGDARASLALISVATFAYSAWAANVLTLPADLFPPRVVASVSGVAGTGAALGGMVFTLIIGAVVDRFSYLPVFVAAGLMPVGAAAFILGFVRPIER